MTAYALILPQNLTDRIKKWCQANRILDLGYKPGNPAKFEFVWPPYSPITVARIIRKIDLDVFQREQNFVFNAYSGAFINHMYPPLKVNYGDTHAFQEADLVTRLNELKKYADMLREEDLVEWEKFTRRY